MKRTGLAKDFVSEIGTEATSGSQIDPPAEQLRKLDLQLGHAQVSDRASRLKLDENVDVALGTEVVADNRAKQRQAPNAIPRQNSAIVCSEMSMP